MEINLINKYKHASFVICRDIELYREKKREKDKLEHT